MSLALKISKKAGAGADTIGSRSWQQSRISIGRGAECTLVLEDPKKHLSRVHVELEENDEGRVHLTVVSKVNPVFVNGTKHSPDSRIELSPGDCFALGEYELELLPPPSPSPKVDAPAAEVEETTLPDHLQIQMPKMTAPADPAAEEANFLGQELPPVEPGLFDEPEVNVEVDVSADATYVSTSRPAPSMSDEATYIGGRPPGAAGMREAVSAFLEGAGLAGKEVRDAEIEEFLRRGGRIMRAAIEGCMVLLAARATLKKELRAEDRTMAAAKDDNPLKLMSDPQEALAFLFDTRERSDRFLDPAQALGDAFEDLRTHEVALLAAMRAALLGAIKRFDPKLLEAELEKNTGGLGLNRKAKLWELFAGYQQKLARDADDDFNKIFGREFVDAYMAQVQRLRGG